MEERRLLMITMKNRFIQNNDVDYQTDVLHIFAENRPADQHNSVMLLGWRFDWRTIGRTIEKNNKKYKHKGGWKVFFPLLYKKKIVYVSLYFPLFTNWFLSTWWNYLKLGTNVQKDRPMITVSQIFFLAPSMYFTERKANFGLSPFFLQRAIFL